MEIRATKIVRRSIFIFLKDYQFFTNIPVLLMLPFSVFVLLLQAFSSSSTSPLFVIHALGFSPSLQLFLLSDFGVSYSIFSSVFSLPFTLSSLVMAKGYIIQALNQHKMVLPPSFSSLVSIYRSLFLTQVCNSVIIFTANAVAFSVLFMGFNSLESFDSSSKNPLILFVARSFSYSFLANTMVLCNFALVVTGMENCSGYLAVFKACSLLRRCGNSRALLMALPANLGAAAVGALFHYRIVRAYHLSGRPGCIYMALEGLLIAYLYSLLIVLDTIVSCLFFKSCKPTFQMDQIGGCHYQIELVKGEDNGTYANRKIPWVAFGGIDYLLVAVHTNEEQNSI